MNVDHGGPMKEGEYHICVSCFEEISNIKFDDFVADYHKKR